MDANSLSEKDMLNACLTGDKNAWDAFVEKYTNLIYYTLHKTLKTYYSDFLYQDVEDIHNSIFLSLMENDYKKLKQYKGINNCSVSSWLMVVTANFTLNFIKKHKSNIPIENNSNDNKNIIDNHSIPQAQPDDELVSIEHDKILRELTKELNPNDRLFLKLYYEKELPPEEIAEILNLSVSAIYSKKNRITGKLKKIAKKNKILQET